MKDKTKKHIKRIMILLVVIGVLYGLAVGVGLIRLKLVYHALRHDGRPMTLEAIIPEEVADHENAALLYACAMSRLRAEPAGDESLMDHLWRLARKNQSEDPNQAVQQGLDQWLESDLWQEILPLVQQGTQRAGCRFDLDYYDGFDIKMSHLRGLRALQLLMARQAERLATQGQSEQAWQLVETMARFSEATIDEPLLVNQLVRIAQIDVVLETIQSLCQTSTPSAQQISALKELFVSFGSKEPMLTGLDGERLISDHCVFRPSDASQQWRFLELGKTSERLMLSFYKSLGKPLLLADQAYYLDVMQKVSRGYDRPYASLNKEDLDVTENPPRFFFLSQYVTPAFYNLYKRKTSVLSKLHVTSVGLDLIDHHRTTETYPGTLQDWPQESIRDPFTGVSLMYRKEASGFLLYSLGPDKKDDYGQVDPDDKQKGDIAWHYDRPK